MKKSNLLATAILGLIGIGFIIGVLKINMENTKVLAPLGVEYEENFEMVSAEFGEDFEDFIRDNAKVKVYEEEDGVLIRVGEVNLKIKNNSELLSGIKDKIGEILDGFDLGI